MGSFRGHGLRGFSFTILGLRVQDYSFRFANSAEMAQDLQTGGL